MLYKGLFNFHGGVLTVHENAPSSIQAFYPMIRRLARRLGQNEWFLIKYYESGADTYEIKLVHERRRNEERRRLCQL